MKILCSIDGGGIRGLLPATLLAEMQAVIGPELPFSMVSGTSTGGILATGLSVGIPAREMLDLYVNHGTEVFNKRTLAPIFGPKYSADKLEALLQKILGGHRLSDCSPELLVPAYCVQLPAPTDTDGDGIPEGAASWFFKSWKAKAGEHDDLPLWQVARATSAAPTYFPTAGVNGYWFVDGGVFANNPALCAVASAYALWPGETFKVLSIGTGTKVTGMNGPRSQSYGLAQWAPEVASVFMDGAADTVSYVLQQVMKSNFMRCETALVGVNGAFDDASPDNIANLKILASKFTNDNLARVLRFLGA